MRDMIEQTRRIYEEYSSRNLEGSMDLIMGLKDRCTIMMARGNEHDQSLVIATSEGEPAIDGANGLSHPLLVGGW